MPLRNEEEEIETILEEMIPFLETPPEKDPTFSGTLKDGDKVISSVPEQKLSYMNNLGVFTDKGIIILSEDIDTDSYSQFLHSFLYLQNDSKHEKITFLMNTPGGDMTYMFSMYDLIRSSKKPIKVIATGEVCSAGVLLLACAHERVVMENTVLMSHQGSFVAEGKFSEMADRMKWVAWMEKRWAKLMALHAGKTERHWFNLGKKKAEFWVLGGEAIVEAGIADRVANEEDFRLIYGN